MKSSSCNTSTLVMGALALWNDRAKQIQQEMAAEVRNRKNDRKHDVVLLLVSTILAFLLDQIPPFLALILKQ